MKNKNLQEDHGMPSHAGPEGASAAHAMSDEQEKKAMDLENGFCGVMFNANPHIMVLFDETLRLVDCNPAALEYFGYENKEELLVHLIKLIDDSIPAFQPDGSPSTPLNKRFAYVIEHGYIEFEVEMVLHKRRTSMRFTLKKVPYGESFVIAGYILDMQQLKEARNELLRQDLLMRRVNGAATRLMSVDPKSFKKEVQRVLKSLAQSVNASQMYLYENVNEENRLYCKELYTWDSEVSGVQPDDGRQYLSYSAIPQWMDMLEAKRDIHMTAKGIPAQYRGFFARRSTKVLLIIPVFLQGEFWGLIGLNKSVNEELFTGIEIKAMQSGGILAVSAIIRNGINKNLIKAREAALNSDKAKSEFLSRMSHEIRTPMNAIIGMTAIAKKTGDIGKIHYSLDKIEAASAQLLNIINDILDMSKIESGKLTLTPVSFDLRKMLSSVYDVVRVRFDEKQQRFRQEIAPDFAHNIVCDELRLTQILINLLTNASKFTPAEGSIALRAFCRQEKGTGAFLHVEIEDTGIGISAEQQSRLFHSFEQADGSITRRFGGTGLGLAICKSLTELMGGDISVKSEQGQGATFLFDVKISFADQAEDIAEEPPLEEEQYFWPEKQVLLVEDVEINREIVIEILRDTGVKIDTAKNGLEAVDLFAGNPGKYDMILMDLQMPELDGYEATGCIREMEEKKQTQTRIPIVAMTANAFKEDIDKCLQAGMNGHVSKPIDVGLLMEKMAQYL
ncbi:response regulator [Christensenellaceae bacterium OttesenSCG-928-M15]|nr:response regulator [Christensenellaceae bacterium OttesenSCG-928-M15]